MNTVVLQTVIFLSVLFVLTADNNVNSADKSPQLEDDKNNGSVEQEK